MCCFIGSVFVFSNYSPSFFVKVSVEFKVMNALLQVLCYGDSRVHGVVGRHLCVGKQKHFMVGVNSLKVHYHLLAHVAQDDMTLIFQKLPNIFEGRIGELRHGRTGNKLRFA